MRCVTVVWIALNTNCHIYDYACINVSDSVSGLRLVRFDKDTFTPCDWSCTIRILAYVIVYKRAWSAYISSFTLNFGVSSNFHTPEYESYRLDGKHGVGVPESEPRSRSPGVEVPESDVIKIWKTRSHMENTESTIKYGKHGVWRQRKIWKTRSLAYCQREIWKIVIK
jgi:hypothetical protein